jgi:hypothetical protein
MRFHSFNNPTQSVRGSTVLALLAASGLLLSACGGSDSSTEATTTTAAPTTSTVAAAADADMDMDENSSGLAFPEVFAYYDDQEILFIHTAASDEGIANTLQDMMGSSPVIYVESLADIPASSLATVYVFANGSMPEDMGRMGPLGFQPDIFDSVPGDEAYSPLRGVVLVTWADPGAATTLTSVSALETAVADGLVTLEESGIVVNMPLLQWPDGQR